MRFPSEVSTTFWPMRKCVMNIAVSEAVDVTLLRGFGDCAVNND